MKNLVTASVIAIASATTASAALIGGGAGPGTFVFNDANLPTFFLDDTNFFGPGEATWTFENDASKPIVFADILTSGLSFSLSTLEAIDVTFGLPTTTKSFEPPFVNNGGTVEGSVGFSDFVLSVGDTVELNFDATGIGATAAAVDFAFSVTPIPVPATLPLIAGGLGLLALFRRKAA